MIADPTPTTASPPSAGLENEVLLLRATLDDALGRIHRLEERIGGSTTDGAQGEVPVPEPSTAPRPLIALDAPAMTAALALCAEVFPNSRTKLEVLNDPDDPGRSWRLITVYWRSSVREAIDQQSTWHNQFDALHPEAIHDISLFVVPE